MRPDPGGVRLLLPALLALLAACEPLEPLPTATLETEGAVEVADCRPCLIRLDGGTEVWSFFFDHSKLPDNLQVISKIRAQAPRASAEQVLPVEGMLPMELEGGFRFGSEDLDGDGWRDLLLVTADGGANAYAAYWRFDPKTARFDALGTLPLLGRDPDTGRLVGLEHGSADGAFFTRTEYGFEAGRMIILAVEARLPVDDPTQVRHVVQERRGGELVTTVDETVPAGG